VKIPKRLSSN